MKLLGSEKFFCFENRCPVKNFPCCAYVEIYVFFCYHFSYRAEKDNIMALREKLGFKEEPLYVMDGNAFIFRGFFANQRMARSDSFPTGSIHIVGKTVFKILREEKPQYFLFVLDGQGKHFRHELYAEYKANRPPAPEELKQQFEPVKTMLKRLGIHVAVSEEAEADDYIASLAKKYSAERPVVIIGMDKDLKQCLNENVVMWDPASKEEKIVTMRSFMDETGLVPEQWADVQALIGDSSDNIPGIKGIGEKTAIKLFQDFPSLENIKENFGRLPAPIKKKLDGNLEAMFLYRKLTTLNTSCCSFDLQEMRIRPADEREVLGFFKEYELSSLTKDFEGLAKKHVIAVAESSTMQGSLFSLGEKEGNGGRDAAEKPLPKPKRVEKGSLPSAKNKCLAFIPGTVRQTQPGNEHFYFALCPVPASLQAMKNSEKKEKQEKTKKAKQEQSSLFSLLGEEKASVSSEVFALPYAERSDYWYAGEFSDLIPLLQEAELIVSCDVKALFHSYPLLWEHFADKNTLFDLSVSAWLLSPDEKNYTWLSLANRHAAEHGLSMENPATVALSMFEYDVRQMEGRSLLSLMAELEMPLASVLFAMEKAGIQVNVGALFEFLEEVRDELDVLTDKIYEAAGTTFNIRSGKQLSDILFKKLDLPMAKSTKGGQASTSQDVLEKLAGTHPVIEALQEFRKLEKLRSTYLEPLPKMTGADSRIHTSFNQTGTGTGRLSSSNPNLQNIPVRGELGRRMRRCFVAREGHLLVSADYSQVELRVLAHCSGDMTLRTAFLNNEDIHARTAALLYDIPLENVTQDMRRHAKTINFGLLYGMGQRKLSQDLHIGMQEAKRFMEVYFERFQTIKEFYEKVENFAREHAYVVTIAGRQRSLPDIMSNNHQARAMAERQSINTLIQGSAADIIKLAMLAVHRDKQLKEWNARLLLQIHDELILEVPEEHAERAGKCVAEIMMNIAPLGKRLSVPLLVEYGVGKNWGQAH